MDQKSPEAFRTISEVADWLGVPTHVLRFWESRFSQIKPVKRAGGRRYYRPGDMELLGGIRQLLHDDGMTIRGVQKLLREQGVKHVAAMSPPLGTGADTRDVTPDNVVDLSNRRSGQEASATEPEEDAERRFPFDDEPVPQPPAAEAAPDAATVYEAPAAPIAGEVEASEPETPAAPETIAADMAEPGPAPSGGGQEPVTEEAQAQETEPEETAIDDALPSPEAMEFFAHDAAPEEPEDRFDIHRAAPAEPVETEADDAMSSPDALEFAAHDAQPDLAETGAQPTRPGVLSMPQIGPDPENDAYEVELPAAARLRLARSEGAAFSPAALQAFADRLDELTRRDAGT